MTRHLVVRGDSLACAPFFERAGLSAHLVVTSPPYNANMAYGSSDRRSPGDYLAFLERFLRAADAVLVAGGHLVVNVRDVKLAHRTLAVLPILDATLGGALGYSHLGTIRWIKGERTDVPGRERWPASWPLARERTEPVFVFRKPGGARPSRLPLEELRRGDVAWRIDSVRKIEGGRNVAGHPCPFPVELPRRAIEALTEPGEWVFDPFGGTATTSLAAAQTDRNSVCMELSDAFCALAHARLVRERADRPHVRVERL